MHMPHGLKQIYIYLNSTFLDKINEAKRIKNEVNK